MIFRSSDRVMEIWIGEARERMGVVRRRNALKFMVGYEKAVLCDCLDRDFSGFGRLTKYESQWRERQQFIDPPAPGLCLKTELDHMQIIIELCSDLAYMHRV